MLSHSSPGELTRKYCNCYKLLWSNCGLGFA